MGVLDLIKYNMKVLGIENDVYRFPSGIGTTGDKYIERRRNGNACRMRCA